MEQSSSPRIPQMAFPLYYSPCKIFPKFIGPLQSYFTGQLTCVIQIHLPVLVNIVASGFVFTLTRAIMSDFRAVSFRTDSGNKRKDFRHSLQKQSAGRMQRTSACSKLSLCPIEKQKAKCMQAIKVQNVQYWYIRCIN